MNADDTDEGKWASFVDIVRAKVLELHAAKGLRRFVQAGK
jgi:hypothetical protein